MRFQLREKPHTFRRLILPLCILALALVLFYCGVDQFSESTTARQKESLEKALASDITYCYATEGRYPDSAEYLEKHYGLTYDKEKFYIGYQSRGANILPDVTVIELGGQNVQ